MKRPSQILFFSRPHDMRLHVAIARRVQAALPETPVRFVTFFRRTVDFLREAGLNVTYLPDRLREAQGYACLASFLDMIEGEAVAGSGGANLQLMLQAERFLPTDRAASERFLNSHVTLLDRMILSGTLSISSMFDHFVYWLAGSLANARGGWHFSLVGSAVPPNRTIVLRTPWQAWQGPIQPGDADALLRSAIEAQSIPVRDRLAYMSPHPAKGPRGARYYYNTVRDAWFDRAHGSYFSHDWLEPGKWAAEKLLPRALYRRMVMYPEPVYDIGREADLAAMRTPFVYFPLHMEPEATLLMYSPWCRDQVEAARLVSQALPAGWRLLIKENPKMRGVRRPDYYRRLRALPNSVLVDPAVSSGELVLGARATVSIAGNASLEAVLLGRPGICLGRPPFRHLLTLADFSSGMQLSCLFESLRCGKHGGAALGVDPWQRWVAGTVSAALPYTSFGTEIGFPDGAETVEPIWKFIRQVTMTDGTERMG